MALDLLHRLRWRNLARAIAVVALVGVVVAWPRVGPPPSRPPGSAAVPLVKPAAPVVAAPGDGRPPVRESGRRRAAKRSERAPRPRAPKRPQRAPRRAVVRRPEAMPRRRDAVPPVAGSGQGASPVRREPAVPHAAPPSQDPVQAEFGIEGG